MGDITVLTGESEVNVSGSAEGGAILIDPLDLSRAIGWSLEAQGLCRGATCVPLARNVVSVDNRLDLTAIADALQAPIAFEPAARVVAVGEPSQVRAVSLREVSAPDFVLELLSGDKFRFTSIGRAKKLLLAWASW